jgi:hypothetical protein
MQSSEFDWHAGNILYWDLGHIASDKPIELQYDELKEDLAQVEFGSVTLLDIGWYPEFSSEGRFVVSIVRNQEWEEPVFRLECKDVPGLYAAIRSAIDVARKQASS